ncbi:MAG: nucleoside phosphorylase [Gammaproteobacteria bacterium]|nr:nucleoside phosphorylase [Gammaproteobacteria bacterium]
MQAQYPILEFDDSSDAIIEPSKVLKPVDGMPERGVLPIYHTVIAELKQRSLLTHLTDIVTAMGPIPVYRMRQEGKEVVVTHPGLCAPFAAAVLEELIAFGCRKFIACGSAGVLDSAVVKGTVIVPSSAVRDEGTSFHYVAPSRGIAAQSDSSKPSRPFWRSTECRSK